MIDGERVHDEVRLEYVGDGVASLIMERGDAPKNAFTSSKVEAMAETVEALAGTVDCLVLAGEDEFSVGADLDSIRRAHRGKRPDRINAIAGASNRLIRALRRFPAPVIAAVRGVAAGGGLGFALACDLVEMHEGAVFDTAYLRIGLTPDNGTSYFLANALGPYVARKVLFDPDPITATEAVRLGLATTVYDGPESSFLDTVLDRAATFAAGPTDAFVLTRTLVDSALEEGIDDHLERERETISGRGDTSTFREGLEAFFEKRDPKWS